MRSGLDPERNARRHWVQPHPCGGILQRVRVFRTNGRTQTQCSGSFQVMTSRRDRRSSLGEVPLGMVLKVGGVHTGSCGEVRTVFQVKAQRSDSERPGRKACWVQMAEALGARKKSPQFMRQHGALAGS